MTPQDPGGPERVEVAVILQATPPEDLWQAEVPQTERVPTATAVQRASRVTPRASGAPEPRR